MDQYQNSQFKKANNHALSKNGKCLSEEYVKNDIKLLWKCSVENHAPWFATFNKVVNSDRWCPECAKKRIGLVRKEKVDFNEAHKVAEAKGGKCLSEKYIGTSEKYIWKCSDPNHESWEATYTDVVKLGRWCPKCKNKKIGDLKRNSKGLEMAKEYAISKDGECLSTEYINNTTLLLWKCKNNHIWESNFANVVSSGTWCVKCFHLNRKGENNTPFLERARKYALLKGGECLSTEYFDVKTKLLWKCKNGHQWERDYTSSIRDDYWCRECNELEKRNVYFINAQKAAHSKKGKLLSTECVDLKTKLLWECKEGHQWKSLYYSVVEKGCWCPLCSPINTWHPERKEIQFKKAKEYAESKYGELISKKYNKGDDKLEWECQQGHRWFATLGIVSRKSWCPVCAKNKPNEYRTIKLISYLLEMDFPSSFEDWNRNPKTGRKLELDGYNKENKIAIEVQGIQHYQNVGRHKNLHIIQQRDFQKKQNCIANGVKLIIIDGRNVNKLTNDEYYKKILTAIESCNIKIFKNADMNEVYNILKTTQKSTLQEKFLNQAKEHAKLKNGKCLSNEYFDSKKKLLWECEKKHQWEQTYSNVVTANNWCPFCTTKLLNNPNRKIIQLNKAKEHAKLMDGECLSTTYVNQLENLEWKCKHGHIWYSKYYNVVNRKTWCPVCSRNKT